MKWVGGFGHGKKILFISFFLEKKLLPMTYPNDFSWTCREQILYRK